MFEEGEGLGFWVLFWDMMIESERGFGKRIRCIFGREKITCGCEYTIDFVLVGDKIPFFFSKPLCGENQPPPPLSSVASR